jgi:hypothetical protein
MSFKSDKSNVFSRLYQDKSLTSRYSTEPDEFLGVKDIIKNANQTLARPINQTRQSLDGIQILKSPRDYDMRKNTTPTLSSPQSKQNVSKRYSTDAVVIDSRPKSRNSDIGSISSSQQKDTQTKSKLKGILNNIPNQHPNTPINVVAYSPTFNHPTGAFAALEVVEEESVPSTIQKDAYQSIISNDFQFPPDPAEIDLYYIQQQNIEEDQQRRLANQGYKPQRNEDQVPLYVRIQNQLNQHKKPPKAIQPPNSPTQIKSSSNSNKGTLKGPATFQDALKNIVLKK